MRINVGFAFYFSERQQRHQNRVAIKYQVECKRTGKHKLVVAVLPELFFDLCLYVPPHPQGALRDAVVSLAPRKVCRAQEAKHMNANKNNNKNTKQ